VTKSSAWTGTALEGLGLPEPLGKLGNDVTMLDDTTWGTRPGAPAFRGMGWFDLEVREDRVVEDYVLAGFEDISTGVAALHYFTVWGPLAMFLQIRMERNAEGAFIPSKLGRDVLATADRIQQLLAAWPARRRRPANGRLIVTHTIFSGSEWHWTGKANAEGAEGLASAVTWLEGIAASG
jgi:hypothetical protein